MFILTKSFLFYPLDYVPYTGRRFTVSYEMKNQRHLDLLNLAFRKC